MQTTKISVFGAGAWGTALALQLALKPGNQVTLWGHLAAEIAPLIAQRENKTYLPGVALPENIEITADLEKACQDVDYFLIVVPSQAFVDFLSRLKEFHQTNTPVFWATKGFDLQSGRMLHEALIDHFPHTPYGILSGPTFALEVARRLPTAITCAGNDPEVTRAFAECLHEQNFRCYVSDDVIGVQVGGALKNILAIAVGITDGLKLGANTRAALMTRGLSEIMRYGIHAGGQAETFMGLAGIGDLVLTCTDDQSRNRRFGLSLGRGCNVDQALEEVGHTVEGLKAAKAIEQQIQQNNLDLPILSQVCNVLFHGVKPEEALQRLLERSLKRE